MTYLNPTWTEERVTELRGYLAQGLSASIIARRLGHGITRNAVIGKLHRMGLRPAADRPGGVRWAAGRKRKSASTVKPKRSKFKPDQAMLAALRAAPDTEPAASVDLQDLKPHHCRFPYGARAPFRFCGCTAVAGISYCEKHAAKCFTADAPRVRSAIAEHRQKVDA